MPTSHRKSCRCRQIIIQPCGWVRIGIVIQPMTELITSIWICGCCGSSCTQMFNAVAHRAVLSHNRIARICTRGEVSCFLDANWNELRNKKNYIHTLHGGVCTLCIPRWTRPLNKPKLVSKMCACFWTALPTASW